MKKILAFGTFDVLHPGHLNFFKQAKELGDELHVIVALDETVLNVKGRDPLQSEETRLKAVLGLNEVDYAYLGNTGDKYQVIEDIRPDIIALGYDQTSFTHNLQSELKKRGVNCEIVRLKPFHPEKYKSSMFRDAISN